MPQRNVASNFTFEQQRVEINNLAQDFWTQKGTVDTAASTYLKHDGSNVFTGQSLAVPNAFTINSNSGNGTVTISGNLDVTGTTTTVSSANLEVTDKNILIAKGSTSDAQADGAGITIDSATDITFNFVDAKDALVSSIGLEGTTFLKAPYGQFTGSTSPTTGQGIEINAPDANTGQIISYDRGGTAYKELRLKGSSVPIYTGTTNALVGTFNSTGLDVVGNIDSTVAGGNNELKVETTSSGDASLSLNASGSGGHTIEYIRSTNVLNFKQGGGSVRMSIAADGTVDVARNLNANLGLDVTGGDLTVGTLLDVNSGSNADNHSLAKFKGTTVGNMAGLQIQYYACGTDDNRTGLYWQHENVGNHRMWMDDAGFLRQKASNPTSNTDGNAYAKIGATNPSGNLIVTGAIESTADTTGNAAIFTNTNTTAGFGVKIKGGGTTADRYALRVDNAADEEKFRVNADGMVGIGVSQPAVAGGYTGMEIGGTANNGIRLSTTSAGGWAFTDYEINGSQKFIVGCKGGPDSLSSASSWRICSGASFDSNQLFVVNSDGSVLPGSDNSQDLGSTSYRWANLYTGDLNLCNEGSYNEVDGTSGSWTMQEGDSDLFLINRKSGKKYKFNLTEVS